MDRRDILLAGLDLSSLTGAEIGPLTTPLVSKADGEVIYIDHADTATLREKYRDHPDVDVDAIVQVDAIWGEQTIAEALGPDRKVDYVVASHVVEHAPDLVTWLAELASVLRPGGSVRLAVPDRRFCFDYLREDTRLTDVLAAYFNRARRPQVREVIDSEIYHRHVDLAGAWAGTVETAAALGPEELERAFRFADRAQRGEYVDVHCWAFTPASFAGVMEQLGALGLISLACEWLRPTRFHTHEFFVAMTPADQDRVVASWRQAKAALEGAESAAGRLAAELEAVRQELAAVRRSTSWRMTAPLRHLVTRLRGNGGAPRA